MKKIETVPIDLIRIDLRDDISLRTYVLLKRERQVYLAFCQGLKSYGLNPKSYEAFLDLYQDIRVNGLSVPIKAQKINGKYYIEDGAHRLSIARALGMSTIKVEIVTNCGIPSVFIASPKTISTPFNIDTKNPRILKMFDNISTDDVEKFVNLNIPTDQEKSPMTGAAVFWPTSYNLWPEMLAEVKRFHKVEKVLEVNCKDESTHQSMILDFYKSDDVAPWKVEAKFPYCSNSPRKFLVVKFNIEDARHRIKGKTGNEISMAIEDLKGYIRSNYRPRVANYPTSGTPDLLIHAGDNEYQTREILKTLERFKDKDEVEIKPYGNVS